MGITQVVFIGESFIGVTQVVFIGESFIGVTQVCMGVCLSGCMLKIVIAKNIIFFVLISILFFFSFSNEKWTSIKM